MNLTKFFRFLKKNGVNGTSIMIFILGGVSNVMLFKVTTKTNHNFVVTTLKAYIYCPSCHSTNIKKNGHTYYGKQNHRCNCCGRQFVLNNNHTKSERLKSLIKNSLKERISLRGICRIFDVSLTWLQSFAHLFWEQTPDDLGLNPAVIKKIKLLQVFGIQADELWSFVQKKRINDGFG
ncbi:MAG: transposase-like protein [Saprospiraceae bacterium]|jgi:transposase-like protein